MLLVINIISIPKLMSACWSAWSYIQHYRKRPAEEPAQSEEEVKRQRLAKLAAWRQQQAGATVKAEQPSSPQPLRVFDDDPEEEDEKSLKQEAQSAAWWDLALPQWHHDCTAKCTMAIGYAVPECWHFVPSSLHSCAFSFTHDLTCLLIQTLIH